MWNLQHPPELSTMSEASPFRVVGIGEVLWDLLPSGRQLGGAPANFVFHAQSLGTSACVISRIGDDAGGEAIRDCFERLGLSVSGLQKDAVAPTGTVTVKLSGQGIPEYTIHENVAWDRIEVTSEARSAVRDCEAICFGSLAQRSERSRASIRELLQSAAGASWRIFDINLRQRFYHRQAIEESLQLANVLKLNDQELPVLAEMFGIAGSQEQQIEVLAARFALRAVALTRGADGSLLWLDGRLSELGAQPVAVKDTVGAGDAFTAGLVAGLLRRMDLDAIHRAASEVARFVCSCDGGTPPLPQSLRETFLD